MTTLSSMKERLWVNHKRLNMEKGFFPPRPPWWLSASHLCVHISGLGKAPTLFYRSVVTSVIKSGVTMGLVLMNGLEKIIKCINRVPGNNQRPSLAQLCSREVFIRSPAMKANWRDLIAWLFLPGGCFFILAQAKVSLFWKNHRNSRL